MHRALWLFAAVSLALPVSLGACDKARSDHLEPSGLKPTRPVLAAARDPSAKLQPIETTYDKLLAARADDEEAAKALVRGDETAQEKKDKTGYIPAEYKAGAARWKDVGVYVDGVPMGFLTFGELPIALKPVWLEERASVDMMPGQASTGEKIVRQRYYRFTDYLRAVGVDPRVVKELHVYGPKLGDSTVATGKELMSPAGAELMFRFGSYTSGKPIPRVPEGFGNGKSADKIASVMVYVKKKPPTYVRGEGFVLDGEAQTGVPYYGEPIRGGIRVYRDDKLVAVIKRQELDANAATKRADGELQWKLADQLRAQGVDMKKVVEMWVVRDEQRAEKFDAASLETLTFAASAQAKGGIQLGEKQIRANSIALHTRHVTDAELPRPTREETE